MFLVLRVVGDVVGDVNEVVMSGREGAFIEDRTASCCEWSAGLLFSSFTGMQMTLVRHT